MYVLKRKLQYNHASASIRPETTRRSNIGRNSVYLHRIVNYYSFVLCPSAYFTTLLQTRVHMKKRIGSWFWTFLFFVVFIFFNFEWETYWHCNVMFSFSFMLALYVCSFLRLDRMADYKFLKVDLPTWCIVSVRKFHFGIRVCDKLKRIRKSIQTFSRKRVDLL